MPDNLLQTGGAGLGGGMVGAIMAFFGLKTRINSVEKTLDKVVFRDLCDERYKNLSEQLDKQDKKLDKQSDKLDAILNKV